MATATPAELLFLHLPGDHELPGEAQYEVRRERKTAQGPAPKLLKPALLKSSLAPYPAAAVALSCNLAFHLSSHTATMEP